MDRLSLDEQLELLRGGEPEVADARQSAAENEHVAARARKIQAYDAVVGAGVRDVAVPDGLANRVLDRISRESVAAKIRNRRHYVVGGISAAIALTLLIVFSVWRWPDPTWTNSRVAAEAGKVYGRAGGWLSLN